MLAVKKELIQVIKPTSLWRCHGDYKITGLLFFGEIKKGKAGRRYPNIHQCFHVFFQAELQSQ